eukprot:7376711-Prymnesium_polylepis.2
MPEPQCGPPCTGSSTPTVGAVPWFPRPCRAACVERSTGQDAEQRRLILAEVRPQVESAAQQVSTCDRPDPPHDCGHVQPSHLRAYLARSEAVDRRLICGRRAPGYLTVCARRALLACRGRSQTHLLDTHMVGKLAESQVVPGHGRAQAAGLGRIGESVRDLDLGPTQGY